jgi:hypothetical protein
MVILFDSFCLYACGTVEVFSRTIWEWSAHRCAMWEAAMRQPAIVGVPQPAIVGVPPTVWRQP